METEYSLWDKPGGMVAVEIITPEGFKPTSVNAAAMRVVKAERPMVAQGEWRKHGGVVTRRLAGGKVSRLHVFKYVTFRTGPSPWANQLPVRHA